MTYFSNSANSRINGSNCGISASVAFRIFNFVIPLGMTAVNC